MSPARDGAPPSRTARVVATLRAQHQTLDRPRIFDDPFAIPLLGDDAIDVVDRAGARVDSGPRLYVVARARLVEDLLADAVERGVRHYVVLGAGLDTFALRNPFPELLVIEVDQASTQAWKRERLARADVPPRYGCTWLTVDLTADDLAGSLATAGVVPGVPTFFSLVGVSYYLPEAPLQKTLEVIAGCGAGTELVLDYYLPPETLESAARRRMVQISAAVRELGEPFRSLVTRASMTTMLRNAGFTRATTFDTQHLFGQYPSPRVPAGMGFANLVHARR